MSKNVNTKKTIDEYKKEVYDLVGNEYLVLGNEYISNKTKILMRHNSKDCIYYKIMGEYNDFEMSPNSFLRGERCAYCSGKPPRDTKYFKKEVEYYTKGEYTVLGEYTTCMEKIKIRHNCELCNNHEWEVTPNKFLSLKRRCPKCKGIKHKIENTKTLNEYKKEIYDLVGDKYTVLGTKYISNKTKILMKHNCELCNNHEWEVTPNAFLGGTRCPECALKQKTSKFENEIFEYIESIYDKDIIRNNREILNGKELDIYLPDIKLAIEYNGCYYHDINHHDKFYHLDKYNICKENNITLITIWEGNDNWKDIIKSFINDDPIYNTIYKDNLVYISKDYENLEDIVYDDELNKYYEYIGDVIPNVTKYKHYEYWNIGYKIYREIYDENKLLNYLKERS